jgi:thiamine-monophosphate kinase
MIRLNPLKGYTVVRPATRGSEGRKTPMSFHRSNEDSILKRISERSRITLDRMGREALVRGIGDDAALFRPQKGRQTILTCDWFLEGTHFLREKHPPDSVGWKCLARALSDIAAMGGKPRCSLLSLALPASLTGRWLNEFLGGLRRVSAKFQCPLAGGDTTCREEILINVTVVGEVQPGRAVLRSGARPGDLVYVSGRLGEADMGLRLLKRRKGPASRNPLTKKHLYPEPRLALGQWLAANGMVTAMMDLSDGLSSDLPRLCVASEVGARVTAAKIPTVQSSARNFKSGADPLHLALNGGDDYELLFTVPSNRAKFLSRSFRSIPLTPIGVVTSGKQIVLADEHGREYPLHARGWDPFRSSRVAKR